MPYGSCPVAQLLKDSGGVGRTAAQRIISIGQQHTLVREQRARRERLVLRLDPAVSIAPLTGMSKPLAVMTLLVDVQPPTTAARAPYMPHGPAHVAGPIHHAVLLLRAMRLALVAISV